MRSRPVKNGLTFLIFIVPFPLLGAVFLDTNVLHVSARRAYFEKDGHNRHMKACHQKECFYFFFDNVPSRLVKGD